MLETPAPLPLPPPPPPPPPPRLYTHTKRKVGRFEKGKERKNITAKKTNSVKTRNKTSPNRQAGTLDSATRLTRHPVSTPPSPRAQLHQWYHMSLLRGRNGGGAEGGPGQGAAADVQGLPFRPRSILFVGGRSSQVWPRSRRRPTTRTASSAFWARSW